MNCTRLKPCDRCKRKQFNKLWRAIRDESAFLVFIPGGQVVGIGDDHPATPRLRKEFQNPERDR